MKQWSFTVILFLSASLPHVAAQNGKLYTVSGYVYDAAPRETLIGANIYDRSLRKGTVSNNYGFYSLSLPPGEVVLSVSYVGFGTRETRFRLTGDTVIHWLMEASETLEEIVVEARRGALSGVENTQLGAVSLPPALVRSVPAILGEVDLVKVLQQMPGVSAGTEGFSGLYVRGGNRDENLYLIDGNPVYDVNHLFGFFSTFNTDAVKSAEFYKGSFPARFGGRLSSVVDVRTKDGNMQDYHGSFTLGLISSRIQLEGPLVRDKASFSVAFRRTYLDLLTTPAFLIANSQMEDEKDYGGYHFYDLNAKLNYRFSDRSRMYLNWYSGEDAFNVRQEWLHRYEWDRTESLSANGLRWNWGNRLASLNWNYIFSAQLFGNMSVIYSRFHSRIRMYERSEEKENGLLTDQSSMTMHYSSGIRDIGYRTDFDYTPHPNHYIRFGSNYLFHTFRPEENGTANSYGHAGVQTGDTLQYHNDRVRAHEWAVYAEDDVTLSGRVKINAGLHFSLFHVDGHTYTGLQPRVSARFLLGESLSVKAACSGMNQYVHLLSSSTVSLPTDLWVPVTKNIRPMYAGQFSAGAYYNLHRTYDFSLEAWYKTLHNVIEYRDGVSMFMPSAGWQQRVATGRGTAYGLELLAQRSTGKLTGWVGYGLSWVDRQFPGGEINDGRRFWAKYDNRHKVNVVACYRLNDRLELNGSWTYFSGNRMTVALEHYEKPPLLPGETDGNRQGASSIPLDGMPYYSSRNNYRMSDCHRLDLGFNFYRPKKKGRMAIWNLSVYNAYCRLNPVMARPDGDGPNGGAPRKAVMIEYSLFPLIPSFSYTYKF
ncbi:MAG: TonB-dependent receptor [Tannerella sp.]|nr:TonB-dependent receptor [Tannerella sp.]